jgi:hypothetical protein
LIKGVFIMFIFHSLYIGLYPKVITHPPKVMRFE